MISMHVRHQDSIDMLGVDAQKLEPVWCPARVRSGLATSGINQQKLLFIVDDENVASETRGHTPHRGSMRRFAQAGVGSDDVVERGGQRAIVNGRDLDRTDVASI